MPTTEVREGQKREYVSGGKAYGCYVVGPEDPQTLPFRPISWAGPNNPRLKVSLHVGAIQSHPEVD